MSAAQKKLRDACRVVERYARTIGKDCEVIFLDDGVQVAPLSWSGSVFSDDLYEALTEARENDQ